MRLYVITLISSNNNNTWFGVGSSFSGIYKPNTTDNIPPSSDVYYILNFNNILTSYGEIHVPVTYYI